MATLDELFVQEKAWIAACDDVDALLDRIGEWQDDVREAEAHGRHLVRMRAGDLVELGRRHVVRLKAAALKAEERAARPAEPARKVTVAHHEPTRPVVRDRIAEPVVDRQREAAEQRRRTEAASALEAEAKAAATRMANARAAKIEAEAALAKAQAAALTRESATAASPAAPPRLVSATHPAPGASHTRPVAGPSAQTRPPARSPSAPAASTTAAPRSPSSPPSTEAKGPVQPAKPAGPTISHEDQLALMSVGRWPPTGPAPGHPFWARDQDWPSEWTLTGFDLSRFRGRINVTQKVLATQLGVTTAVVAEFEKRPREKVGPAMQIALRRAMDVVEADERRRREAAAAERAAPARAPVVVVAEAAPASVAAPATPVSRRAAPVRAGAALVAASAGEPLTGADLARLRGERQLSQRKFAELLGVGHGMVAKAEVAASEPLGDRMREALRALLAARGGSATG